MRTNQLYDIYQKYERPFYVYEEEILRRQTEMLKNTLPKFEFLYSVKTNPMESIVAFVAKQGFGADAASVEEVMKGVRAGIPKDKIIFSSPGRTMRDFEETYDKAVITADSFHELEMLQELAEKKDIHLKVGIRINPDYTMSGGKGTSNKFGVDEEELPKRKEFFASLKNISICGVHVHIQSQILSYETLYRYYKKVLELSVYCQEEMGFSIEFVNFGGGVGLVYDKSKESPLDIEMLSKKCDGILDEMKDKLHARLIIESGRFVVCEAGTYYTPIIDSKISRGMKYLLVKNTLNGFMRPSLAEMIKGYCGDGEIPACEPLYTEENAFAFGVVGKETNAEKETVTICGNLCTGADVMAKSVLLPKAEIGDLISVDHAGSYAFSLSALLFSSHKLPLQVYLGEDGTALIEE